MNINKMSNEEILQCWVVKNEKCRTYLQLHPNITIDSIVEPYIEMLEKHNTTPLEEVVGRLFQNFQTDIQTLKTQKTETLKEVSEKIQSIGSNILNELKMNKETEEQNEGMLIELRTGKMIEEMKGVLPQSIIEELKKHQKEDNEKEQKLLNEIKFEQNLLKTDLKKHLEKYNSSGGKGSIGEDYVENLLKKLYYEEYIITKDKGCKSGDIILARPNKQKILFEVKYFSDKGIVPENNVVKFRRDIQEQSMSGIMIALSSGIYSKNDYNIEIDKNKNILMYLSNRGELISLDNIELMLSRIQSSIEFIDSLGPLIKKEIKGGMTIDEDLLRQISEEYDIFEKSREELEKSMKQDTNKHIKQINELGLPNLYRMLSSILKLGQRKEILCNHCGEILKNSKAKGPHETRCQLNPKNKIKKENMDEDLLLIKKYKELRKTKNEQDNLMRCETLKNKKMQTNNDIDIELQETQSEIKENTSSENIMETYPSITLQSLIDDIKKGHIDTYNNNQEEEEKEITDSQTKPVIKKNIKGRAKKQ